VWTETFRDNRPSHELRDSKGLKEFLFFGDKRVSGIGVDAMEEVGLFVVMRGEEDIVDDSLKDLEIISGVDCGGLAAGLSTDCV
jgi:hypothetical protein